MIMHEKGTDKNIITKQVVINTPMSARLLPITADKKIIDEIQQALTELERLKKFKETFDNYELAKKQDFIAYENWVECEAELKVLKELAKLQRQWIDTTYSPFNREKIWVKIMKLEKKLEEMKQRVRVNQKEKYEESK